MDDREQRREERRKEREARREARHHWREGRHTWMPGLVLILIGAVFLLRNYFGFPLNNWWALFILFPALGAFFRAYELYTHSGRFDRSVISRVFAGLIFTLLSVALLFSFDFGLLWPVFLILAGLGILLGAF